MSFKEWLWQPDSSLWDPMGEANTGKSQGDLIYSLSNEWYTSDDREQTRAFFKEMGLPLPQKSEFIDTRDMSPLVFLSRYGLVLRVMHEELVHKIEKTNGHDMVLQPLKIHYLEKGAIAILPSVRLASLQGFFSEELYAEFLMLEGQKTKLATFDTGYNNIGMLPRTWQIDGQTVPFPVIVDYGSFKPLPHDLSLAEQFNTAAWHGIQARLYEKLKGRLLQAWPENESSPRHIALRQFFDTCEAIMDLPTDDPKRILHNGWEILSSDAGCKTIEARKSAQNYERAIQRGPSI